MWLEVAAESVRFNESPHWRDDAWVQLEGGRLEAYCVSRNASGILYLRGSCYVGEDPDDDTRFTLVTEGRRLLLVTGSTHSRDIWMRTIRTVAASALTPRASATNTLTTGNNNVNNNKGNVILEGVLIKSPTRNIGGVEVSEDGSASVPSRTRRLSTTGWIKSVFGAWHHRMFRLYSNGSLDYHEVASMSNISLTSRNCVLFLDESSTCEPEEVRRYKLTIFGDSPAVEARVGVPSEPIPQLSDISRRISRLWSEAWREAPAQAVLLTTPKSAPSSTRSLAPMTHSPRPPPPAAVAGSQTLLQSLPDDDEDDEDDDNPSASSTHAKQKPPDVTTNGVLTIGFVTAELRMEIAEEISSYAAWYVTQSRPAHRVVCKGWMMKKGTHPFSAWKPRYFVLMSSKEMFYYENERGHALGVIKLTGLTPQSVHLARAPSDAPSYGIKADIVELDTPYRTWRLCPKVTNKLEYNRVAEHWVKVIKGVINGTYAAQAALAAGTFRENASALSPLSRQSSSSPAHASVSSPGVGATNSSSRGLLLNNHTLSPSPMTPPPAVVVLSLPVQQTPGMATIGGAGERKSSNLTMFHRGDSVELAPPLVPFDTSGEDRMIPIVPRTRWQHITGNLPIQALSPSPLRAALDVNISVPPTSRSSFLKTMPSSSPPPPKHDFEMV